MYTYTYFCACCKQAIPFKTKDWYSDDEIDYIREHNVGRECLHCLEIKQHIAEINRELFTTMIERNEAQLGSSLRYFLNKELSRINHRRSYQCKKLKKRKEGA